MAKKINEIYQFKISLNNSKPLIWRRILVPANFTFRDLHSAIQDAMGWFDFHLHMFEINDPGTNRKVEIGVTNEEFDDYNRPVLNEARERISKYFSDLNPNARYEYDFGDSRIHTIKFEKNCRP